MICFGLGCLRFGVGAYVQRRHAEKQSSPSLSFPTTKVALTRKNASRDSGSFLLTGDALLTHTQNTRAPLMYNTNSLHHLVSHRKSPSPKREKEVDGYRNPHFFCCFHPPTLMHHRPHPARPLLLTPPHHPPPFPPPFLHPLCIHQPPYSLPSTPLHLHTLTQLLPTAPPAMTIRCGWNPAVAIGRSRCPPSK